MADLYTERTLFRLEQRVHKLESKQVGMSEKELVAKINELQALAWDEGYNAGVLDTEDGCQKSRNPYAESDSRVGGGK